MSVQAPRAALLACLLALVPARAEAQPPEQPPDQPPEQPPPARVRAPALPRVARGLRPDPVIVEALGLRINLPNGAIAASQVVDQRTTVTVIDPAEVPAWSMRIQPLVPRPASFGAPVVIDPPGEIRRLLDLWREGGRQFRIAADGAYRCDGRDGHLTWVRYGAAPDEEMVSGWLVLPNGPEMMVFATQMVGSEFDLLRPLLERCFATIRLREPGAIARTRHSRLEAGKQFIADLTSEQLRSLVGRQTWYRHFLPAAVTRRDQDHELGYYVVSYVESDIGALDSARYDLEPRPGEPTGLLVIVRGQHLERAYESTYASDARYWLAWDLSEEGWTIRGTRRREGRAASEAQTGVRTPQRTGEPQGTITVISSRIQGTKRDQRSWPVPDVYLSQALRWPLGALLPQEPRIPRTYSFYSFDATAPELSISLRVDHWNPAVDGSDNWILSSQTRTDAPKVVAVFDPEGNMLRRTWADGTMVARIELDNLFRLWRRKGLPTGSLDR